MSKHDLQVSFQRQIRQVTVNDQTKLGEFIRRALDIFDLKIEQVAGIKYFFVDAYVYFGESDENSFSRTIEQFFEEYEEGIESNFEIELLEGSLRNSNLISEFKNNYINFFREEFIPNFPNHNFSNYFFRPSVSINNYYSSNSEQQRPILRRQRTTVNEAARNIFEQPRQTDARTTEEPRPQNNQRTPQNNQPFTSALSQLMNIYGTGDSPLRTYVYNFETPLTSSYLGNYSELLQSFTQLLDPSSVRNILTDAEVNALPRGEYQNLRNRILPDCTQCTITLEEFTPTTNVLVLPCRHAFKESAIVHWLRNNSNKCPVCRTDVAQGVPRNNGEGFLFS